jgi:hypothetical protein
MFLNIFDFLSKVVASEMLPIPVNMLRPASLPTSPVMSPIRRGPLPRSFTELEASDLEKMLLPQASDRKCSLQTGNGSLLQTADLETMLAPKSPLRRESLQFYGSPSISEYESVLNSKPSDFELPAFTLPKQVTGKSKDFQQFVIP